MNLSALLYDVVAERPDHPALLFEDRALTYGELWSRSGSAAARLSKAGAVAGDRVGLLLPNVPGFPIALYGALRLGAIAVPLNPGLTGDELEVMIADAGIRVLVTVDALARRLDPRVRALSSAVVVLDAFGAAEPADVAAAAWWAPVPAESPAVIVFSSGTTGHPKGVTLSHGNLISNIRSNVADTGMRPDDRAIGFMPLFHCYGLNVIMNSAFATGATVVLERRFDPRVTPETIARHRVTLFFGVPTMFIVLLHGEALDALASLRWCYCAAAPLPRNIEDRWRDRTGLIVTQAYGLSEAAPCVTFNPDHAYRPGSVGRPGDGVELRVVDPQTGRDVPVGTVGELWVRSPGVMLGYWGRPEATAAVMRDGWLRTGDLGRCDSDGYYYVTDRLKDMINSGGMKVYPAEVEDAVYRHPAVAEAAVVGVPDETMGEVVHAYVTARRGQTLEPGALRAFLGERLAAYKQPTTIRVVPSLPKGRTGKILRRVVRQQARARAVELSSRPAMSRRALEAWIVDWMREALRLGDDVRIAPDGAFAEMGVDSLLAVRKAEALSTLLGYPVPATVTWLYPTPAQLAAYLSAPAEARRPTPVEAAPVRAVTHLSPPRSAVGIRRVVSALSATEAESALLSELAALGV